MWWDAWLYECRGGDISEGFVVSWLGRMHRGGFLAGKDA